MPSDADQQTKFKSGDLVFASGNRLSVWDAQQERLGLTLATQWRPADNVLLTLDALHGEKPATITELSEVVYGDHPGVGQTTG